MNDGVQYCIPVLHEDIWILCIKRFIAYLICTHSTVYQSCIMMKSGMQYCIPVGPAWWWMMVCSIVYLSVPHDDENWYAVLFPVPHEDEWWYAVVYTCPAWWWMMVFSQYCFRSRSVVCLSHLINEGIQYTKSVPYKDSMHWGDYCVYTVLYPAWRLRKWKVSV